MRTTAQKIKNAIRVPRWVMVASAVIITVAFFLPISTYASSIFGGSLYLFGVQAGADQSFSIFDQMGLLIAAIDSYDAWTDGGALFVTAAVWLPFILSLFALGLALNAHPLLTVLISGFVTSRILVMGLRATDYPDSIFGLFSQSPAVALCALGMLGVLVGSIWLVVARGRAEAALETD